MSRRVQQFITAPQGNPRKPICNPSRFASWLNCICFKRFSCARSNESWTWGFGKFLELPKVVHLNWQTYRRIGQEDNKLYLITLPLCGLSNILLTKVKPKHCAPGWRHPSQMHQDFLCICAVWETKVLDNSTQSMEMKLKEVILSRVVEGRDVIEFDHANSDNPSDWSPHDRGWYSCFLRRSAFLLFCFTLLGIPWSYSGCTDATKAVSKFHVEDIQRVRERPSCTTLVSTSPKCGVWHADKRPGTGTWILFLSRTAKIAFQ